MFSQETLKYVGYVVRFGCAMSFLPYEWASEKSASLRIRRSRGKLWYYWIFNMWIGLVFCLLKISVYLSYMLRLTRTKESWAGHESKLFFELLFVIAFSYGWVFYINTFVYAEEIQDFFNNIMTFNKRLSK
jgi:hypothetical protein